MSSPTCETQSPLSVTPTSRGNSPVRHRSNSVAHNGDGDHRPPRVSPTVGRIHDPKNPESLERQRQMDADMAMHMNRARRETSASISPVVGTHLEQQNHHSYNQQQQEQEQEQPLSALSPHEQDEIHLARGDLFQLSETQDGEEGVPHPHRSPSPIDLHIPQHLHQGHDPSLLVSNGHANEDVLPTSMFGLPTYQANVSRSTFDFTLMEAFASEEKAILGINTPAATRFAGDAPSRIRGEATLPSTAEASSSTTTTAEPPRATRQRKLSQSNTAHPRHRKGVGGKMALFEGNPVEPPPTLAGRFGTALPGIGNGDILSGGSSAVDMSGVLNNERPTLPPTSQSQPNGILNSGHDRPYRFSFYSNALSATIHARSLSELPAEGQSFEDLFTGLAPPPEEEPAGIRFRSNRSSAPVSIPVTPRTLNGLSSANVNGYFPKLPAEGKAPTNMVGRGGDFEGSSWWLDVQSPTDDEMKMLSKVFNIHPLTTEDIQMEETREKIELFRNYYLVCFRSFDQDPYSPTHLEPLNMYIIVFREGTLSFHFRPTPHPQNVRRRIKQLKDYISVTSDWISYALIDDITDAFGPLIQSIEYEVDSIDELVLILKEAEQSDMLRRIGTCRKKVMGLLRLMGNKADVVKGLAKRCNENWRVAPTSDIGLYLSDIQDHLITMTQNLNHYEKILSRSHSNYLAQISIEMTDANNQINDVLSKLTALGTVLIPMNLVTGLWGMNVHVPGQDIEEGYTWFVSIIACLAAFAVIGGYTTYKVLR